MHLRARYAGDGFISLSCLRSDRQRPSLERSRPYWGIGKEMRPSRTVAGVAVGTLDKSQNGPVERTQGFFLRRKPRRQKTRPPSKAASGRQPGFCWHMANGVVTRTKITPTSLHISTPIKRCHCEIQNGPLTSRGAVPRCVRGSDSEDHPIKRDHHSEGAPARCVHRLCCRDSSPSSITLFQPRTVSVSAVDWQKFQSINSDFPRDLNFMMVRVARGPLRPRS